MAVQECNSATDFDIQPQIYYFEGLTAKDLTSLYA